MTGYRQNEGARISRSASAGSVPARSLRCAACGAGLVLEGSLAVDDVSPRPCALCSSAQGWLEVSFDGAFVRVSLWRPAREPVLQLVPLDAVPAVLAVMANLAGAVGVA